MTPSTTYSPWNSPGQNTGVCSHSTLSRGSSQTRDRTQVSRIAGDSLPAEPPRKPLFTWSSPKFKKKKKKSSVKVPEFHPILNPYRWSPSWGSPAWGYMDWYSFKTHPTCYLLNKPSLFNFRPKAYAILLPSLNTLCLCQSFSLSHYDLPSLLPMPTRLIYSRTKQCW